MPRKFSYYLRGLQVNTVTATFEHVSVRKIASFFKKRPPYCECTAHLLARSASRRFSVRTLPEDARRNLISPIPVPFSALFARERAAFSNSRPERKQINSDFSASHWRTSSSFMLIYWKYTAPEKSDIIFLDGSCWQGFQKAITKTP